MIAYIKGKFVDKNPSRVVVETAAGLAYFVNISLNTSSAIRNKESGILLTHLHIKEDAHTLYGFHNDAERALFLHLISVSGIGPSTAQIMLSSLSPHELQQAILENNVALLKSVKGIGAKTAQRMILELRDKMIKTDLPTGVSSTAGATTGAGALRGEAIEGLMALGINKIVAQKTIDKVLRSKAKVETVEDLIKEVLNNM